MKNNKLMRLLMLASSICLATHTALFSMEQQVDDNSAQSAETDDEISRVIESVANMALSEQSEETTRRKLSPPPGLTHPSNAAPVFDPPAPALLHKANSSMDDFPCGFCESCINSTGCNRSPLPAHGEQTPDVLPLVPPNSQASPLAASGLIFAASDADASEEDGTGSIDLRHNLMVHNTNSGWSPFGRNDLQEADETPAMTAPTRRSPPLNQAIRLVSEEEVIASIIGDIKALPDYNAEHMPEEVIREAIKTVLSVESADNTNIAQVVMAAILASQIQPALKVDGEEIENKAEHVEESRWAGCRRMKAKAFEQGRQAYETLPEQAKQFLTLVQENPRTAAAVAAACLASWWQVR
ncbi:hypothetical protein FJ365_02710 [Candidatus Dependentiae bacterium]|nr:hypothetical protein [Candidatus Dependentiae bacterium]